MNTIKKPVLLRLFLKLQWVVIPLIIVAVVEYALRKSEITVPLWYSRAEAIASREKVDFLFIGSSKVAAAFVEDTFDRCLANHLDKKIVSINLGQGNSSPQLHYLGLRNLIGKYPESLKKVTLFIEAFAGTPLYQFHNDWKSKWIYQQPQLLVPLLRFSDLKSFWQTKNTSTNDKLNVTFKYLMAQSYIISFRERTRQKFEIKGQELLAGILRFLLRRAPPPPEAEPTIQPIGGIKTNPKDLERIRELGRKYYAALPGRQRILNQWDKSVLADIIRLIKQQGGNVFFVNLPAYSAELNAFRTPEHDANKLIIKEQLKKWGAAVLTPDFVYTDDDIPDYFHLGISRAREFTEKLAQAYVAIAQISKTAGSKSPSPDREAEKS